MTSVPQTSLFPQFDPEDSTLEFKSCATGILPNDLWKAVTAFANTEGGRIILGIGPDQQLVGLTPQQIDKLQQDFVSLCQNSLNYPITPDIQVTGSTVVAYITPAAAAVRPIYSRSRGLPRGAYIRIGSSNTQITDEMLNQFAAAARGGAELIEYPELTYETCFNSQLVESYIRIINKARNNIFANLETRQILEKMRAVTTAGKPTLFGLLAFGEGATLQDTTAPTTNVAVTQYAGTSKVNPDNPELTYLDDRDFNGNVITQFEEAFSFIRSKLPVTGFVDADGKRRDTLSIPEIAIREALANALTHRDYGTYSSRVQVDIYSDRIEIINPGTSLVPIENIDSTPSFSRNPSLMSFLKDFHITEQRARGIRTIRDALHGAGLSEPSFENLPMSFRVTLFNSAFISREDQEWLQQFRQHRLNDRQLTALTQLRSIGKGISNSEYRRLNHMKSIGDDRRANYELNRMYKLGLVRHDGADRNRRYYLNDI
jgi:ATP-dependent DNA helicase RecG